MKQSLQKWFSTEFFLSSFNQKIGKSEFRKNLMLMIGGSAFSQLIPILLSFFLARLYSPSDFGVLSNYLSIMGFLVVVMFLKYELAIVLPKKDTIAANLVVLCLLIGLIIGILFTLIFYFFDDTFYTLLKIDKKQNFLILVPIGALAYSILNLINEWFVRKKNFKSLIGNKVTNNTMIIFLSGMFAIPSFNAKNLGLVKGQIIGQIFAIVSAVLFVFKKEKSLFRSIDLRIMKRLFHKYRDFAKFNIPGQLFNSISGQLLIWYMTVYFGLGVVGLYMFMDRIMGAPLAFVGNAVKDVFKQKASVEYREKGECINLYKRTSFLLAGLVLIPFIILFFFAPDIFALFFGEQWRESGIYARIFIVANLLNFITMPTGWLFVIAEKQQQDMFWQVINLSCTVISLLLSYFLFKDNVIASLICIAVAKCISYTIQMLMTYYLALGKLK